MKHDETRLRAAGASKTVRSKRGAKDEIDANRLTASILAPFDKADFEPGMTADDISARFGPSREAAEKRLKEFERIYRRRNGLPGRCRLASSIFCSRKGARATGSQVSLTQPLRR
ncbi:ImmA/IrrE family metallo-endopeptidase [Bradyrhizobium sp.]|uniref:ImmA/IrrE family metallo-endopeptidase n=1 Tax=Bradyrhizobium sp. TaxID=376 RepID=UPI003C452BED